MVEVREVGELGAGVDEVWKLVGDFGGLIEAMGLPVTVEGEGIGQIRKIAMGPDPVVERLEERDEQAKRVTYTILSGPLPVANYSSTMQLSPAGDGRTRIEWSGNFDPAPGSTEEEAKGVMAGVYQGGIKAMQGRFGA